MFHTKVRYGAVITAIISAVFTLASSVSMQNSIRAESSDNKQGNTSQAGSTTIVKEDCNLQALPVKVECFRLSVPENRSLKSSRLITVGVTVLKSTSITPLPDPVVFIPPGPGMSGLDLLPLFAQFSTLAQRDFIVVSPRGTGRNNPNLDCPELRAARQDFFLGKRRSFRKELPLLQAAASECAQRLRASGVDLNAYSSIEIANDIADLRVALGIKEWNLYGASGGTRQVLQTMRAHPEGIRSVILDSAAPPDDPRAKPTLAINWVQSSFAELFSACKTDPACDNSFPNLDQQLNTVLDRYNKQPYSTQISLADGRSAVIEVNGNDVLRVVWQNLQQQNLIPQLPLLISELNKGNSQAIEQQIIPILSTISQGNPLYIADGLPLSIQCIDSERFIDASDRRFLSNPGIYSSLLVTQPGSLCSTWGVQPVGISFNQPVRSQIPTLLLAGRFDSATLPSTTQRTAAQLSHSTYVEIPNSGTSVTGSSECARSILAEFIDNPNVTPDASCTKSLQVEFELK